MRSRHHPLHIAPSILSADFAALGRDIAAVERGGADVIHVDVMDGHFVPNMTIGPLVVRAIKRAATRPVSVHLMIEEPDRFGSGDRRVALDLQDDCSAYGGCVADEPPIRSAHTAREERS